MRQVIEKDRNATSERARRDALRAERRSQGEVVFRMTLPPPPRY